jgi:hypothetical protein
MEEYQFVPQVDEKWKNKRDALAAKAKKRK